VVASLIGDIVCGAVIYPGLTSRLLSIPAVELYKAAFLPVIALLIPCTLLATMAWVRQDQFVLLAFVLIGISLYPAVRLALRRQDVEWVMGKLRTWGHSRL